MPCSHPLPFHNDYCKLTALSHSLSRTRLVTKALRSQPQKSRMQTLSVKSTRASVVPRRGRATTVAVKALSLQEATNCELPRRFGAGLGIRSLLSVCRARRHPNYAPYGRALAVGTHYCNCARSALVVFRN